MSRENLEGMMEKTMDQIKQMVNADVIIGKPIESADGTTVVPISKITYGFGAGGGDISSKNNPTKDLFSGGGGAGVSIVPVAFLTVFKGNVKVIQVEPYTSSIDRIIEVAPDAIEKIIGMFKKDKETQSRAEAEKEVEKIVEDLKKESGK